MKIIFKLLIVNFLLLHFTQCNSQNKSGNMRDASSSATAAKTQLLAPQDFEQKISEQEGLIIDVRTPQEFAAGHIENASSLNFLANDFLDKMDLIQKNQPLFVYCKSGNRSSKAAETLRMNGFEDVYELDGGIMAWQNENLPVVVSEDYTAEEGNAVSVEDFLSLQKNHKKLLVEFSTTWCAPCRLMKPIVEEVKEKYKQDVFVQTIDLDESQTLGQKLNLRGVPVFILYKNGEEVWRHLGLIKKEDLEEQLNQL